MLTLHQCMLKAELFDPDSWAKLFSDAGVKYVDFMYTYVGIISIKSTYFDTICTVIF